MEKNDHLIVPNIPFGEYRRQLAVKLRGVFWAVQHAVIASTLSQERVSLITKRGGLQKEKKHGPIDGEVIV